MLRSHAAIHGIILAASNTATCLEMPGANGQGETREECLSDLQQAVQLLLETEREEAFRLDPDAETAELVVA